MNRTGLWVLAAAMVVVSAGPASATIDVYPEAALGKINLFRQMDLTTGKQVTTAQWVEWNTYGYEQYPGAYAIDGGKFNAQFMFNQSGHNTDPNHTVADNMVSLLFTMASPQPIGTLMQDINANTLPTHYRVKVSNDLSDGWTVLTGDGGNINDGWVTTGSAKPVTDINGAYKYIQIDYWGTPATSLNLLQVVASPMEGATISTTAGYNLMALHGLSGGTGPVTAKSGWAFRANNPNSVLGAYNGALIQANGWEGGTLYGPENEENWFVIPLNDLYTLAGFAAGFEHGQCWTGITIWYTDEDITSDDWDETRWKVAYTQSTTLNTTFDMIPFTGGPVEARYVRVGAPQVNGAGSPNMLSGFELYAMVPEPATMVLLATGALALLRRRT